MNNEVCIIIPCYNTDGQSLNICLQSVYNSDYSDFYVVIVDDGSSLTETKEILHSFKNKYDNTIILTNKTNKGVSFARNTGILFNKNNLHCEYVIFVDADDYISPDYISKLALAAHDFKADCVTTQPTSFWKYEDAYSPLDNPNINLNLITKNDAFLRLSCNKIPVLIVGKLYRSIFLESCLFNILLKTGEDVDFLFRFFSLISTVCIIENYVGYRFNRIPTITSLSRNVKMSNKRVLDGLESNITIINTAKTFNDKQIIKSCYSFAAESFLELYPRFSRRKATKTEIAQFKKQISFFCENKCINFFTPYSRNTRYKKYIWKYCKPLYKAIYNLYIFFNPGRYD